MRYFDDDDKKKPVVAQGQQTGTEQEQAPAVQTQAEQTQQAPGTGTTPVTRPVTASQTDPYADYQRQAEKRYATTLADIRQRRKELDAKYQPDIDRQKRVMKIIALGKLIGQLGQLGGAAIGGAAGTPVVDKDPYQINAWKELNRLQAEQKYYGQQLDAEEKAARNNMQTGLDKLRYENMRQNLLSKNRREENEQRYKLMRERDINQYALKTELETLKQGFRKELENAKGTRQLQAIYARGGVALKTAAAKFGYKLTEAQVNAILKDWVNKGGDVLRDQGPFPDVSGFIPVTDTGSGSSDGRQTFDYGDSRQRFDY